MTVFLRREFAHRSDLIEYLRRQFPAAVEVDAAVSETRGGRRAAEARLAALDPVDYARTRNELDGAVTALSPYIRHGIVGTDEVRDVALTGVKHARQARKLISELGWRDYFQRIYAQIGHAIWADLENYKTGFDVRTYADSLPGDLRTGQTGLACIDAFVEQLHQTGYLHNHARMWLAAYVVHWRRVRWQAGAAWFLQHLLDGDPASNNLSWQWVASTFSHKPYYFNRENLDRFSAGRYCRDCPLAGRCDFEGSYEELAARLFPSVNDGTTIAPVRSPAAAGLAKVKQDQPLPDSPALPDAPVIWIHGCNLSPFNPLWSRHADRPALFVWDDALLARRQISLKRIVFLYESLLELPVEMVKGDVARSVIEFARRHGADGIVTNDAPGPRHRRLRHEIAGALPLVSLPEGSLIQTDAVLDLRRFSRFWRAVEPGVYAGRD